MKNYQKYYKLQEDGSSWTTEQPHYQELLKEKIDWTIMHMNTGYCVLLDLGCGDGWGVEYFLSRNINVIGGDICLKKVEFAIKKGLNVLKMDMHKLTGSWGTIFCSHTLEHSYNWKLALDSIINSLKVNGELFLFVPIEPNDPTKYNPSHTQWFSSKTILDDYFNKRKDLEVVYAKSEQKDTEEYWLMVKKLK